MKKLFLLVAALLPSLLYSANNEARLLRFPSVGGDKIVFSYAGDLYSTSINGGDAFKITSNIGFESFSKISPDGNTVIFTGQYDGNTELYSIPTTGGIPKRLTYSATLSRDNIGDRMGPNNIVMTWTPDGKSVIYRSRWYAFCANRGMLYKIDANGGVPEELPYSEGAWCSYSQDGKYFAFNRMFREFRTWKYYRGGQADEIWINEVGTNSLTKITDNNAQDIFPMWIGKEIYYLSDRDQIMNLFSYNTETKETKKVTNFDKYDCKFPSFSQDYIVFENGGYIYKYTIKTQKCEKLNIKLASDAVYARPEFKEVQARSFAISANGERIIAEARGDIFSIPATEGPIYNITNSSSSHEKDPSFSPDGKTIAYFSDATGEYQLYVAPADNMKNAKAITSLKKGYPSNIIWSHDSQKIFYSTEYNDLYCVSLTTNKVERLLYNDKGGYRGYTLSPDNAWIAYTETNDSGISVIYLYNIESKKSTPVTSKWYNASGPMFSKDGKYLFFNQAVQFGSQYSGMEWDAALRMDSYPFILPLAKSTSNPTALDSDEIGKSTSTGNQEVNNSQKITIDLENIIERATKLPIKGSARFIFAANEKVYYTGGGAQGVQVLDLNTLTSSAAPFKGSVVAINQNTEKLLVRDGGDYKIVSLKGGRSDKAVPLKLTMMIDHQAEWEQIFNETWRVTRDFFYVRNMHGRDWNAIHDKYAELLPYVQHRHDLTYIIGEMIGELNVGHAYVTSPEETPSAPIVKVGLLGAKFSKAKNGTFKIEKIFKGENFNEATRSPLTEPGVNAKVGEYVTAINGTSTIGLSDIYEALVGKAQEIISLTLASTPDGKDARTVYVKTIDNETNLAYYNWVQGNIEKVEKLSNGQIGYIHVPDMSAPGLEAFTKLYFTQLDKKALIIDDRMNGGGNVSPMLINRLIKVPYRMSMQFTGHVETVPDGTHYGPKAVLIDKYSSSDGDLFPYSFKELGLGTIIGKRSWGGIVGISGTKPYLDGQDVRTPFFTSYSVDTGEWVVEGYGVDPDIDVDINPVDDYYGKDAQLEKAVEVLLEQIKSYPALPGIPADPIR